VRGFSEWTVVVRLEPSPFIEEHLEIINELQHEHLQVVVNPQIYGVLHHPWVGFEELFMHGYDFVVRAEDDLPVSDDILEYFEWAAETYSQDQEIAAVVGFSARNEGEPEDVYRVPGFSPWVWGTWADRWEEYISPTWDHDYSTYNAYPGNHAGWDWNLNTRVLPKLGKKCIFPGLSRVQNIGVWGVHGTPENLVRVENFQYHIDPASYVER
jgi:hypothetical protein